MKGNNIQLNSKVVSWLQQGKFKEAFKGEGEYYIQDPTYRSEHNIILIMTVLLEWAQTSNQIEFASDQLRQMIKELEKENNESLLRKVTLAYDIVSKDAKINLNLDA